MADQCLCAQSGRILTAARGYWFSAGGEKGPFGYYPHLKDEHGRPFYPDTQLHGDLRMAAKWLVELDATDSWDKDFLKKVFGREGGGTNALFACSDLVLDGQSAGKWRPGRFQVKPRIKIDPTARTVEEHMLVEKEMAFMDEMALEASFHIGYCEDEDELARARSLVEAAADLLSGFGAQRSRGYGRGDVSVSFEPPAVWRPDEDQFQVPGTEGRPVVFDYCLKALTNFRNKPVDLGAGQDIGARAAIETEQIRAWFARAYYALFGKWPAPAQMRQVAFDPLYPLSDENTSGGPPPMTVMRSEGAAGADEGSGPLFQDVWGKDRSDDDQDENENLFKAKTSPVGDGFFVTREKTPRIYRVRSFARMRNRMDEKFNTTVGGLFSQVLTPAGTWFGGRVSVSDPSGEFGKRAVYVLQNLRPLVRGTWFEPHPRTASEPDYEKPEAGKPTAIKKDGFGVVAKPFPYDPAIFEKKFFGKDLSCFRVGVRTGFNATLGRPRRNRIVVAPGSVLPLEMGRDEIRPWHGLGMERIEPVEKAEPDAPKPGGEPETGKVRKSPLSSEARELIDKGCVTRAQAGFFRELLHPDLDGDQIDRFLDQRMEKFEGKEEARKISGLYKELRERKGAESKRVWIRGLMEDLAVHFWEKKKGSKS